MTDPKEIAEKIIKDHLRRNGATRGSRSLEICIEKALRSYGLDKFHAGEKKSEQ